MLATLTSGDIVGFLGALSLLVSAILVAFGARARTVAQQQGLTIDALEARLNAVEVENRQLRLENATTAAIVVERDKRIAGLDSEVQTLNHLFASASAIEDLTTEVRNGKTEILRELSGR